MTLARLKSRPKLWPLKPNSIIFFFNKIIFLQKQLCTYIALFSEVGGRNLKFIILLSNKTYFEQNFDTKRKCSIFWNCGAALEGQTGEREDGETIYQNQSVLILLYTYFSLKNLFTPWFLGAKQCPWALKDWDHFKIL